MKKTLFYFSIICLFALNLPKVKAEDSTMPETPPNIEQESMQEENDSIVSDDDEEEIESDGSEDGDGTDYSDFLYDDENTGDDANAIYLEPKANNTPTKKKDKIKVKDMSVDSSSETDTTPKTYLFDNIDLYNTKSTSFGTEKTKGNFSFGSTYSNSISPNQLTQTRTLFTKYQKEKFSIQSSYKSNTLAGFDQQFKGSFSFSPEYKINNRLSVQNIYTVNIMDKSSKNEVVFSLKPFKDDRMNLNVGASQINYQDTTPSRSQLNFSTQIKF